MKSVFSLALGILAAIGGFVDFAGVINATQAGTRYGLGLLWTLVPGVVGLIVYSEMAGRATIASGQTLFDVIRERLGFRLALIPLVATLVVNTATVVIEVAGMGVAAQLAIGASRQLWVPLAALALVLTLWLASFDVLDTGSALIGLTMLVAVVALVKLWPNWRELGMAVLHPPTPDSEQLAGYGFMTIGLLGSYMTPYQFYFYSSGAIEERWSGEDFMTNRFTAVVGTVLGAAIYFGLIAVAGLVLFPRHAEVKSLADAGAPFAEVLGTVGWTLFLFGIFAVSLGAGLENLLSGAYALCQYMGWDWGKEGKPRRAPLFHLAYLAMAAVAMAIALTGVDPVGLSIVTMAIAAATLPFTFGPLLVIANDEEYMGDQKNTPVVNLVAGFILALMVVVSTVMPPLLVLSGGGS